jgi:hypothetical protein
MGLFSMKKRLRYLIKTKLQLGLAFRFLIIISMLFAFMAFEAYITAWPVVSQFVPDDSMDLVENLIMLRFYYFVLPIIFVITAFTIMVLPGFAWVTPYMVYDASPYGR